MTANTRLLKGNRGEWGEAYAFCYALATGQIASTDDQLKVKEDQVVLVNSVKRQESPRETYVYTINRKDSSVTVAKNYIAYKKVPQTEFEKYALVIFDGIKSIPGRSFSIPEVDSFLHSIGCNKLKPSDTDKPDITIRIFDPRTCSEYDMSYSVKCMAGARPALVNSSGLTYVNYELLGFSARDFEEVMSIPQSQVKKRVEACKQRSSELRYCGLSPTARTFKQNLNRVHPDAEATLGYMILESYAVRGKHSKQVLERVKQLNPLQISDTSLYGIAFRQYLWAAFCGMVPSLEWKHEDTVDGFLLINEVGDILSYPIVKRSAFERYLVNTTCFDTPSTSSNRPTNRTGEIFEQNGKYYLLLNLLIKYDAYSAKKQQKPKVQNIRSASKQATDNSETKHRTIRIGYH